jgi:hypothetical protein
MATTTPWITGLGQVRRSQVLSTYAIGAIVDLEHGSFMPMGLTDWETQTRNARRTSMEIYEPRLQAQLGVRGFWQAPIVGEHEWERSLVDARYAIPAIRFPEWHECPRCHRLGRENAPFVLGSDTVSLLCNAHPGPKPPRVNPVRFVVACIGGHIDDFPWISWAHKGAPGGICTAPRIHLESRGESASLADLRLACKNCNAPPNSLISAFGKDGLRGYRCQGRQPWLMRNVPGCAEPPRTLQRGASNVHFPVIASALSIPPVSEAVFQMLDEHWSIVASLPEIARRETLKAIAAKNDVPYEVVAAACDRRVAIESGEEKSSEVAVRAEEYHALGTTTLDPASSGTFVDQFRNVVIPPPTGLERWFDLIGAVSRLREVRALAGFTRIQPFPVPADRIVEELANGSICPLSTRPPSWLPGADIRGEGIFLRLRAATIATWLDLNPVVNERAGILDAQHREVAERRGYDVEYSITPRLLLVHSFAHALIRQLAIDCGYSSSSLRERLYVAEPGDDRDAMHGVLIYTGTPDSEGSLGGLVRLAEPAQLEAIVRRTILAVQWCPNDPVCSEADPATTGELVSGAACHSCLLVPETACEKFNRELDRVMLVGPADGAWKGYFDGLVEPGA